MREDDADGPGSFDPLLRGEGEAVQARLHFNPVEFDGIKTRVVELFPDAEELDGVPVPQPVANEVVAGFGILMAGDVREADVVALLFRGDADGGSADGEGGGFGCAHGVVSWPGAGRGFL